MTSRKCFTCVIVVLFCISLCPAALNAYLTLKGETQGDIEGESQAPGHTDEIMVIGIEHSVVSPRDAASGLPTGRRHHEPFKITKEIDKATPLLAQALVTEERMATFELDFQRVDPVSNSNVDYYTVKLHDAQIVAIQHSKSNTQNPENDWKPDTETVHFVYGRIEWEYTEFDGGGMPTGAITREALWDFEEARVLRISDLNFDGTVNLLDAAVMAKQWLATD